MKELELTFNNVDPNLVELFSNAFIYDNNEWKLSRDEVADILEDAADLYQSEQVEWCTGEWGTLGKSGQVSLCAGGAIAFAAGVNKRLFLEAYGAVEANIKSGLLALDPNYNKFREVLDRIAVYLGRPVPSWNDSTLEPKSKPEVIDTLKRAAKDIRDNIERES